MNAIKVKMSRQGGYANLDELLGWMRLNGIKIENVEWAKTSRDTCVATIAVPDRWELGKLNPGNPRGAGRRRMRIEPPIGSQIRSSTTCDEFLSWYKSHTAEEATSALGLTRGTFFSRLKEIKDPGNADRKLEDL